MLCLLPECRTRPTPSPQSPKCGRNGSPLQPPSAAGTGLRHGPPRLPCIGHGHGGRIPVLTLPELTNGRGIRRSRR
jgi:hypothetical protein